MAEKFLQFVKLSWMLIWRVVLFTLVFAFASGWRTPLLWVAILGAGIAVFGFGRSVATFPIIRAIFKRESVLLDFNDYPPRPPVQESAPVTPPVAKAPAGPALIPIQPTTRSGPTVDGEPLSGATQNGRMTGLEPSALKYMSVPWSRKMTGAPGAGLKYAAGMTEDRIKLGEQGEENFARALKKISALDRFRTVWSVPVPAMDELKPGKYDTDIDCVIETDKGLFLVDIKNYKSGDVEYYDLWDKLYCKDRQTGRLIGGAMEMSRNMLMATNAVSEHFPQANVVPVVVFMPTDKGEGVISGVTWPGGIPAINLMGFLEILSKQEVAVEGSPHNIAATSLGNLMRTHHYDLEREANSEYLAKPSKFDFPSENFDHLYTKEAVEARRKEKAETAGDSGSAM